MAVMPVGAGVLMFFSLLQQFADTIWRKVGRSRKQIASYQSKPVPEAWRTFYDRVTAIEKRLRTDGIAFEVTPMMSVQSFNWCTGIDLYMPAEICNHDEPLHI